MPDVFLNIAGPDGKAVVALDPKGNILGRDPQCDILLNHGSVSRQHARIYRNTFGSWIIEDLDSHNGVVINGRRVKSQAMITGLKVTISGFTLILDDESEGRGAGCPPCRTFSVIDQGPGEEVIPYRAEPVALLGPALLPTFNTFTEKLLKLSSSADLYAQACHHLAESIQGFVGILRLSAQAGKFPDQPEVLAYRVVVGDAGFISVPSTQFSRRVLNAAVSGEGPVMVHSHPLTDQTINLTIIDADTPRVVFAAQVNKIGDDIDLLYVDLPAANMVDGMFDFIEAVSRQINFIQKSLFFMELEKKGQALREANRELEEKDRIKDEYVFRVTHDIKGHLAAITSCLSIADVKSGVGSPAEKAEFMERASLRTARLSAFIAELLRLTKLRLSGRMEVQAFSLKESIAKSLEAVEPQAVDKHITLEADVAPEIDTMVGDELSITEVVTNLLFNAIKYTPERESVALRAVMESDHIVIAIRDTGIGIPHDEIDKVFNEFFRASNAVAFAKDGTGLGLALVKQIVERHGGKISAENNTDKGATFTIRLRMING
ncbi:MAG: FHA domain-containing protein [bacterium]|nr:FHA domain-containing protein [bacterium]